MSAERDAELRELIALDAVGALTDPEKSDLETALQDHPDLRRELDGLRAVASALAAAVIVTPPPSLRAKVLESIAATPQLPRHDPASSPAEPAPTVAEPLAPVVPIGARRRWVAAGAVAAAVVALVVSVAVVAPFDDTGDDQVAAVLDDDAARTIQMEGQLSGLSLVHSSVEDAGVLTGDGLPVPAGDRVYELWAIRGEAAPARVDTFRPDDDGDVAVLLAGIDPDSAVWAITEEPAGGSDTPTMPILASTA